MTKFQFLKELEFSLKNLSVLERQDILKDYEEHFTFGLEEGKTEEQISFSLGYPDEIAKELLSNYNIRIINSNDSSNDKSNNILKSFIIGIALLFFNLTFILGPLLGLGGILLGFWITGFSFLVSPILVLIKSLFSLLSFNLFELFSSIGLSGFGILILIGMFFVSKFLVKALIKYIKLNIKLITGGI